MTGPDQLPNTEAPGVITGVYELPDHPALDQELSGKTWHIRIGGVEGTCHLPNVVGQVPADYRVIAPTSYPGTDHRKWGHAGNFVPIENGSSEQWRCWWNLFAVYLCFPCVSPEGSSAKEMVRIAERIHAGTEPWFSVVANWIAVFTAQDLNPAQPLMDRENSPGLCLEADVEGRRQTISPQLVTGYGVDFDNRCSVGQWRLAVESASRNAEPPTSWWLLVNGRKALRRGHNRIAVLEVGTAVEIALFEGLERLDPAVAKVARERKETLGRLWETCRKHGLVFPGLKDFLEHRNNAVHRSTEPSNADARTVVATAESVLRALTPLPDAPHHLP